jgi:hypothetical protein
MKLRNRARAWAVLLALSSSLAASAARATPPPTTLGPELQVDLPVLTGAAGEQSAPGAAGDGRGLLVAWRSTMWRNEIRAARMTPDGEVLDPVGVLVDGFERSEGPVVVAQGGGAFLVAWEKEPACIYVSRVTTDGTLVVGAPLLVNQGPSDTSSHGPAVAWNGSSFWVLWSRNGAAAGVYGARVSPDGRLLDATPVKIAGVFGRPAVAAEGPRALAVWSGDGASAGPVVRGARLGEDGALLDAEPVPLLDLGTEPAGGAALAWNGSAYLLAAARGGAAPEIRAARVGPDGEALDGAGLALGRATVMLADGPTVAWNGSRFVVLWATQEMQEGRETPRLAGALVGADGQVAAMPGRDWTTSGGGPALAVNGPDAFAFWAEVSWWTDRGVPADLDVQGVRLGREGGAAGKPALISRGTNLQSEPVIASGGDRLLVVWEDRREDKANGDVYAARLAPDGKTLDPVALALGTGPAAQRAPAVTWTGEEFLVAWNEGARGLFAARVSAAGEVLDRPPLPVPGTAGQALLADPAVCGDGDGALLAWGARAAGGPSRTRDAAILGLRIPRKGTVAQGTRFTVAATADSEDPPVLRLRCNQRAAVLVWSGTRDPQDRLGLWVARLERGAAAPVEPSLLQGRMLFDEWAGIGTDGDGFLITWRFPDGLGRRTVFGQRVAPDGRLLDDPPRRIGISNSGRRVTTIWDGTQYVVLAVNTSGGRPFDLRGLRVGPGGGVLDEDWFVVSTLATDLGGTGSGADGVAVGPGRSVIVYDQFADGTATGNPRVYARVLVTPPGGPEPGAGVDAGTGDAGADAAAGEGGAGAGSDGGAGAGDGLAGDAPAATSAGGGGCACAMAGVRPGGGPAALLALAIARALARARRRAGRGRGSRLPNDRRV